MCKTLISIDWLQVAVTCPNTELQSNDLYEVELMPYSTRVFKLVYEVFTKEIYKISSRKRIATITICPFSSVLKADLGIVKFDNWLLYQPKLRGNVEKFLKAFGFNFNSISRLDVCCDFQEFHHYKNEGVQGLIHDFVSENIAKNGRYDKFSVYGSKKNGYNSLRFGTPNSTTAYYLYNKTLELNTVKDKPYIREFWRVNGFDRDLPTWRLEFSLKSSRKKFFDVDKQTGLINSLIDFKSLDILDKFNYVDVYISLFNTYFKFHTDASSHKKKKEFLHLLDFEGSRLSIINMVLSKDHKRTERVFIKKLNDLNNELRNSKKGENFDHRYAQVGYFVVNYLDEHNLLDWAKKKQMNIYTGGTESVTPEIKKQTNQQLNLL